MSSARSAESNRVAKADPVARGWRERTVLGLLVLAVSGFYFWTAWPEERTWRFGPEQSDYFNLLLHGFRAGQLNMKVESPPELARLADPYDPAQRPPGLGLHDASWYRGKYYLYFGVAPVVTLLWPFRALTGHDLPLPIAVAVFTTAGFWASVAAWLAIRRRYFERSSLAAGALGVLALGLASFGPVLVRRANIWELPLSSGYCFAMTALLAIERSLHATRRGGAWLAVASAALGLAVASRPTYLFAAPLLLAPVWWRWRMDPADAPSEGGARDRRAWWSWAMAAVLPLAMVGAGIAAHNYARFGDVREFGVSYQFSGIYEVKARHFALAYLPFNFALYFWRAVEWSRYFPFVSEAAAPIGPPGYWGFEQVAGILRNLPLIWFAPLAIAALAPTRAAGSGQPRSNLLGYFAAGEAGRLGTWLAATACLAAGTGVTLGFFYAAMARYQIDFVPALVLLANVGLLVVEQRLSAARVGWRWSGRAAFGAAWTFSIVFGVMLSLTLYGDFRRKSPRAYAQLARIFDYPAHAWETMFGVARGPIELEVRFAPRPAGAREALVRTGTGAAWDGVDVRYEDNHQVQLGLVHAGGGEQLSRPIAIDENAVHHLRVELGSLYPPEEHPYFSGRSAAERVRLARHLRLELDGEVLLDGYQRFHPASPASLRVGAAIAASPLGEKFSGEIRRQSRYVAGSAGATEPLRLALGAERFTALRLRVAFPSRPAGTREPLVVTGETGRGDFLFVEYGDGAHVRFGLDHWGKALRWSESVTVTAGQPCELVIALSSFHTDDASDGTVRVTLDGRPVWALDTPLYPVEPDDIFIGRNPLGGSSCARSFSGTLFAAAPIAQ